MKLKKDLPGRFANGDCECFCHERAGEEVQRECGCWFVEDGE